MPYVHYRVFMRTAYTTSISTAAMTTQTYLLQYNLFPESTSPAWIKEMERCVHPNITYGSCYAAIDQLSKKPLMALLG